MLPCPETKSVMFKQKRRIHQQKWKKDPDETCPKDEHGNNRNITCFVPSCCNRMWRDGRKNKRLIFFQVPDGIDGLFWTKAIRKIGKNKYKNLLKTVKTPGGSLTNSDNSLYCCEAHFDIRKDIQRVVNDDGSVGFTVKPGVLPSVERRQKERLVHIFNNTTGKLLDPFEMKNELIEFDESMSDENVMDIHCSTKSVNENSTNDFPTIVDVFTLNDESTTSAPHVYYEIRTLDDEQQTEINCQPISEMLMLTLTIALMKRKSLYYMGLRAERFSHVLYLAKQRQMSELKVMLTLRKLRLKEPFETLGDLFDLDKKTTEEFFNQSKYAVAELVGKVTTNGTATTKRDVAALESVIKVEQKIKPESSPSRKNTNEMNNDHDDESSSAESSDYSVYYDSEADPDVKIDNLGSESCTSEDYSDHSYSYDERRIFINVRPTCCGLCFAHFETNTLLKVHQKNIHDGAFLCDLCGKKFREKESIKKHLLFVHAKLKRRKTQVTQEVPKRNVKCNSCAMKFVDQKSLNAHVLGKHTYKAPYQCKDCGKTFIKESNYKAHERSHAEDKFVCDICFKVFNFKPYLNTHLKNIHGRT